MKLLTHHVTRHPRTFRGLPLVKTRRASLLAGLWAALILGSALVPLKAEISEPDNLLYGTIVIGPDVITADRTDVVVEARRTLEGAAIASYRMGSNPSLGDFYALRIPVEAFGPTTDPNASLNGQMLFIVLRDNGGVQGQGDYTIPERGHVQRVNFGAAVSDADGNGLPDDWEIAYFGSNGQDPGSDLDGDGQSAMNEWIGGTDPLDENDAFNVAIARNGGMTEVSFVALRAEGPGYNGKVRLYSLLNTADLVGGVWNGVAGFTNLLGDNQVVTLQFSGTNQVSEFFRGQIQLQDQ